QRCPKLSRSYPVFAARPLIGSVSSTSSAVRPAVADVSVTVPATPAKATSSSSGTADAEGEAEGDGEAEGETETAGEPEGSSFDDPNTPVLMLPVIRNPTAATAVTIVATLRFGNRSQVGVFFTSATIPVMSTTS